MNKIIIDQLESLGIKPELDIIVHKRSIDSINITKGKLYKIEMNNKIYFVEASQVDGSKILLNGVEMLENRPTINQLYGWFERSSFKIISKE